MEPENSAASWKKVTRRMRHEEREAMSEETTQEQNGARPFEERVLSALAEMRADFRDFKKELREHFPFVK